MIQHLAVPNGDVACGAKYDGRISMSNLDSVNCSACRVVGTGVEAVSGRHHDCLVRTAHLELELFGGIVSASVKDHVEAWLDAFDARTRAQYGSPRGPAPGREAGPQLVSGC